MTGEEGAGDVAVAATAARAAAAVLVELRRTSGLTGAALGDAADAAAQAAVVAVLGAHRPADVVFSEEAADDDPRRLAADRVWIVDPLDGTREYRERVALATGRSTPCGRPGS